MSENLSDTKAVFRFESAGRRKVLLDMKFLAIAAGVNRLETAETQLSAG